MAITNEAVARVCGQLLSLSSEDRGRVLADIKSKDPVLYRRIREYLKAIREAANS